MSLEPAGRLLETLLNLSDLTDGRVSATPVGRLTPADRDGLRDRLAAALQAPERVTFRSAVYRVLLDEFDTPSAAITTLSASVPEIAKEVAWEGVALTTVCHGIVVWAWSKGQALDLLIALRRSALVGPRSDAHFNRLGAELGSDLIERLHGRLGYIPPLPPPSRTEMAVVVALRGPRGGVLVERYAKVVGAQVVGNRGALVLFGIDGIEGASDVDKQQAVEFALTLTRVLLAETAGIASGLVTLEGGVASGRAADRAQELADVHVNGSVRIDADLGHSVRLDRAIYHDTLRCFAVEPMLSSASSIVPSSSHTFRGRKGPLEALVCAVKHCAEHRMTTLCVVKGDPGMGKTRLRQEALAALAARVPRASLVVVRGDDGQRGTRAGVLEEGFAKVVGRDLARAIFADDDRGDSIASRDRSQAPFEEMLTALGRRGPLLLALEDAHLFDSMSIRLIGRLCREGRCRNLTVWSFFRSGLEAPELVQQETFYSAELPPLDHEDALALLRDIRTDAPASLVTRAGGNPLFLIQLAHCALDGPLPSKIEDGILLRLRGRERDPGRIALLSAVSVFGVRSWDDGIAALGEDPDRLPLGELIVPHEESRFSEHTEYVFRVPLYQEVAYQQLPEGRRTELHRRTGAWLSGKHGVSPAELAFHYDSDRGNDPGRAAVAYAEAAALSARAGSVDVTCEQTARVLALTADPELRWRALVSRDDVLALTKQSSLRREGIEMIGALAEASSDTARKAEAAWRECYFRRVSDKAPDAAIKAGERAFSLAAAHGHLRWGTLALLDLAMLHSNHGWADIASIYCDFALDFSAPLHDPWLAAQADDVRSYVYGEAGKVLLALDHSVAAEKGFADTRDIARQAKAMVNVAFTLIQLGHVDEAFEKLRAVLEIAPRFGNERSVAVSLQNRATIHRIRGRYVEAARDLSEAGEAALSLNHPMLSVAVAIEQVYLGLQTGISGEALAALALHVQALASETPWPDLRASAMTARLRASGDGRTGDLLSEARHVAKERGLSAEYLVELRVAVFEAGGHQPDDLVAARDALDGYVKGIGSAADEARAREVLCQRFLASEALR